MKANTRFGAGRKRQQRGETCQKFQIDDSVDTDFADPQYSSQRIDRESKKTLRRDRYHISLGNDVHCVENETVVFKYDEVNVFTSHHLDRTTNCGISENGRALLRKLDEENAPNLVRSSWTPGAFKDSSEKG